MEDNFLRMDYRNIAVLDLHVYVVQRVSSLTTDLTYLELKYHSNISPRKEIHF